MAATPLLLECEKAPPLASPGWCDIEAVLSNLGPTGSGYVILSCKGLGYVQAAGTRLRLTAEFRQQYSSGDFRHRTSCASNPHNSHRRIR